MTELQRCGIYSSMAVEELRKLLEQDAPSLLEALEHISSLAADHRSGIPEEKPTKENWEEALLALDAIVIEQETHAPGTIHGILSALQSAANKYDERLQEISSSTLEGSGPEHAVSEAELRRARNSILGCCALIQASAKRVNKNLWENENSKTLSTTGKKPNNALGCVPAIREALDQISVLADAHRIGIPEEKPVLEDWQFALTELDDAVWEVARETETPDPIQSVLNGIKQEADWYDNASSRPKYEDVRAGLKRTGNKIRGSGYLIQASAQRLKRQGLCWRNQALPKMSK